MTKQRLIGVCSDHAGFETKEYIRSLLSSLGYEVQDFGTFSQERADYPDYAHPMGFAIDRGELERGIAVCGSGNGINMVMNKHPRVRAALAWNKEIAELARGHNDANVLSVPGRFLTKEEVRLIVQAFLETDFEGGRHCGRIDKIPLPQ